MTGCSKLLAKMVTAMMILAAIAVANSAVAGLKGSKHDMGVGGGGFGADTPGNTEEICVFCHTPHGGLVNEALTGQIPLWNRAITDNSAVQRYSMYQTGTLPSDSDVALGGVSLLCLGCHDGVTAFNNVINQPNSGAITNKKSHNGRITDILDGSNDLANDHPIGMTYAGSANKTGGPRSGYRLQAGAEAAGAVFSNNGGEEDEVTCASCHEVHNSTGFNTFLRADQSDNSGMCMACHDL